MSATPVVSVSVEVAVEPAVAFEIFTQEIGRWWRPGPINWNYADRAVGQRIEPRVGGRWIEVHDEATGEGFQQGVVLAWEPPHRLVLRYEDRGHDIDGTEVEVRFDAIDGGTRVTLEHRGWEKLEPGLAGRKMSNKRWGWANILGWYQEWSYWGSPRRVGAVSRSRSSGRD